MKPAPTCKDFVGATHCVALLSAPARAEKHGLSLHEVVDAVLGGFEAGSAQAAGEGHPIRVGTLLTAMRHAARSLEIAELAVAYRDAGVAGFDIAGAEAGFPPTRHLDAFQYVARENFHITIHAGEAIATNGLVLAEVNFETDEELDSFPRPPFALADVTQNEAFSGGRLCYLTFADVREELQRAGEGRE